MSLAGSRISVVMSATRRPPRLYRMFTSTPSRSGNRAIGFKETGDPAKVLTVFSFPPLPKPPPETLNIRFLLSPINPSDINVIEGVYPSKPSARTFSSSPDTVYLPGNEGLAEVTEVGEGVNGFQQKDRVILTKQQAGTWSTAINVKANDVLKVPKGRLGSEVSEVSAATMTVNPPTAYNMLNDFVDLNEGDWIIQNGANSAVGQAVIQIAAARGLKTINLIRTRDDITPLKNHLLALGATHVLTYEELSDLGIRANVKEWTGGKHIRLGLNCVSGKETTIMARCLGQDACLVSYGAMSKQPLSLPTSLFIFKNLTCRGFWQSTWYKLKTQDERQALMRELVQLMNEGKLKEPSHDIVVIPGGESDEEATGRIRQAMVKLGEGRYGKKMLLRIEETPQ